MQSESKFNSYQNSIKSLHKSLENLKLLNHQVSCCFFGILLLNMIRVTFSFKNR